MWTASAFTRQCRRVLCTALLCSSFALGASFSGRVVRVIDGDTIEVLHGRKSERVRLYGIDCPERYQAYSARARQFTRNLVLGKQVTIQILDVDTYGRTVGEVLLSNGESVNRALVAAGLAWWFRRYAPKRSALEKLERDARKAKRGLWADPRPVAPWEFRNRQRNRKKAQMRDLLPAMAC